MNSTLTKIAFYGGIATFSSCYFMYFKIQIKLCSGHYYTHAVEALMNNQQSRDILGNPIEAHKINLFYTYNVVTPKTAKICIPVSGTKARGYLWCEANVADGAWKLDQLKLEVLKPRTTLTLSNSTDNKT